jgi:hypothetical protein
MITVKEIYNVEPVREITLVDLEIVLDEDSSDTVEIYRLDENHNRIEGGSFKKNDFMLAVLEFYNRNF